MNNSSDFGNRLKTERKKLGLTQAQATEKCGVSARMWGDYERNISQPKAEQLFLFKNAGIDIDYVMTGKNNNVETFRQPENSLSNKELELLALFRQASELGQAVILSAARGAEKKEIQTNSSK
ncbi:helix-turn-helix transcriptional regulator [Simonsiella muelleri]|uniref:helix-turn-helix domain-containing protein n=1 Tax=Simonsiella muelleri TaxID=72 RepID=UPI0028D633F0|nr:helix-turn-helix transcriptional regulator [Simonsiella muelleri]